MNQIHTKRTARARRHARVRGRVSGTADRPRLSVHRSHTRMRAQIIDDDARVTIAGITGEDAFDVGKNLARAALEKGVKAVVFDRGGYRYHGRVKAVAEGARAGGLAF